jgi:hypothetical protein
VEPIFSRGATVRAIAARWPRWTDQEAIEATLLGPRGGHGPGLPEHPVFDPWRDQIERTGAIAADLLIDGAPADEPGSRAGGDVCFLDGPSDGRCLQCGGPMTFCFQLSASDLAPWLPIDGLLTVLYCHCCQPEEIHARNAERLPYDGRRACFVGIQRPRTRVVLPPSPATRPARAIGLVSRWAFPAPVLSGPLDVDGTAAHALLVGGELACERPSGVDLVSEYLALVAPQDGHRSSLVDQPRIPEPSARSSLGGYPRWIQDYGGTGRCERCSAPRRFLLSWREEPFLGGALHVFVCTATAGCRERLEFAFSVER